MGIFKRIKNLIRSNANAFLDAAEDPQKLLEQGILDLKESKKKANQLLAGSLAQLKLMEKRAFEMLEEIKNYEKNALSLLKNNQENEAREIVSKKSRLEAEYDSINHQIENERISIENIRKGLSAVDQKISEIGQKKIQFAKKQNQTNSHSDIPLKSNDSIHDTSAFDTFDQMEEKIEGLEAEVEALQEIFLNEETKQDALKTKAPLKDSSTSPNDLELEIEKLKRKLNEN